MNKISISNMRRNISGQSLKHLGFFKRYNLDIPMLSVIILLFFLGNIVLYSANCDISLLKRQFFRVCLAFFAMFAIAQVPPRIYKAWAPWLYGIALIVLFIVLGMGQISKGAKRWLDLGIIKFQPAEIMKIALPLMLARYFDPKILPPTKKMLIMPFIIILAPVLLIAAQPDLGTALLVASSGIIVIFFSGISWKYIFTLIGVGLASTPVLWFTLRDYQKSRILTLINPEGDPLKSGYHIIQSKIAIGSGGLYGKGWLHGTQSNLEFIPEKTTDFIFSVYSEEFGFIGIILLLFLYMILIIRGLYIGTQAQDTFSRLLASSLILTFFVYVFVNIGMVNGILPVVGIPLPLISYGGTSLVTIMLGFGMLMSIQSHRNLVAK